MKTAITVIGIGIALVFSSAVYAGNAGDGSGYGTQPGYAVAGSKTSCSGAGTFGALGKDASLGTEKVHADFLGSYPGPGTDGTQTGYNNSHNCGSPHN